MANIYTTNVFFDSPDFFAADLTNGDVRVGVKDRAAIDIAPTDAAFAAAKAVCSDDTADDFITNMVEAGRIPVRSLMA